MLFFHSQTRNVTSLGTNWKVYLPKENESKKTISIPSNFSGVDELIYEKSLNLSDDQLRNKNLQVIFLGINYSAEVSLNNLVIYKHPGGDFPFKVDLPKNMLKTNSKNILSVKVFHDLIADATIPVKQRFIFPQNFGGICREVFLVSVPRISISALDFKYKMPSSQKASINIKAKLVNNYTSLRSDSTQQVNIFSYRIRIVSPSGQDIYSAQPAGFPLPVRREKDVALDFDIINPPLWSFTNPSSCRLIIQLFRDDQLIDEIEKPIAFYSLIPGMDSLYFNGSAVTLNGVTLISPAYNGRLVSLHEMQENIKMIKSIGFNAVRFAKEVPHPYYLQLCQEYGLLAFIEIPLDGIPSEITNKNSFYERTRNYFSQFLNAYKEFSSVAAIGLGSSYLSNSSDHINFLSGLITQFKNGTGKLFYASFVGYDIPEIRGLDLYGLELFNVQNDNYKSAVEKAEEKLGRGKVFISDATYTANLGSSNGYLNPFSYEAQAKFFADLLDFEIDKGRSGYFINTAFDYRGDYSSLSVGYNPGNLYTIGIIGENRELGRLAQKVIYSKLNNAEEVAVPLGNKKDDAPLVFILQGMGLALFMGFLINSKKKFREDASRALLRPYNFYADIRDQRILSGFHSNFLMLVISGTSGLLLVNLLYYFRSSFLLDKIILSFGMSSLSSAVVYLAWNPIQALIWLSAISVIAFLILCIIIKIASFFNRSKVFLSSIYFMVIWSFLPLLLLLPLGLILYKVLSAEFITLYILIALVIFTIWIFYRLMKGIYVLFDAVPGQVYFYSIVIILLFIGGILLYFQLTESTIYYILNAYQQYKLM